jgi:hypothetical protein
MCAEHPTDAGADRGRSRVRLSRRRVLAGAAATGATLAAAAASGRPFGTNAAAPAPPGALVAPGLRIIPRDAWGADLPPTGELRREPDVRFLLVHHTAGDEDQPTIAALRSIYAFHTGRDPTKGWADVCYQFFIDRDGLVWEGRAGSTLEPIEADATGGSQGFAQLVCLIGNFGDHLPTPAAEASLVATLAWLAERSGLDTSPGATATFTSRGSNRWRAGVEVTTPTISGHRDMTFTACPGDALYDLVRGDLTAHVDARRRAWQTPADGLSPAIRLGIPAPP